MVLHWAPVVVLRWAPPVLVLGCAPVVVSRWALIVVLGLDPVVVLRWAPVSHLHDPRCLTQAQVAMMMIFLKKGDNDDNGVLEEG